MQRNVYANLLVLVDTLEIDVHDPILERVRCTSLQRPPAFLIATFRLRMVE